MTIEINLVECVHVYDSLFIKPNYGIIKRITSTLLSRNYQFQIHLEKYNFNGPPLIVGCEYAMAFITDLCHKIDPFVCHHARSKTSRKRLICCFQGVMKPFLSNVSSKGSPTIVNINFIALVECHMLWSMLRNNIYPYMKIS